MIRPLERHVAEVTHESLTITANACSFVAALAWNGFIQTLAKDVIGRWFPDGGVIVTLFIYAVIVTILAVTLSLQLTRVAKKVQAFYEPHE